MKRFGSSIVLLVLMVLGLAFSAKPAQAGLSNSVSWGDVRVSYDTYQWSDEVYLSADVRITNGTVLDSSISIYKYADTDDMSVSVYISGILNQVSKLDNQDYQSLRFSRQGLMLSLSAGVSSYMSDGGGKGVALDGEVWSSGYASVQLPVTFDPSSAYGYYDEWQKYENDLRFSYSVNWQLSNTGTTSTPSFDGMGVTASVMPVPEPASLALFAIGGGLMTIRRRHGRHA